MTLTDAAIRNAKPAEKSRKLSDGKGLFLLITPSGGKLWRLKYRYAGKEKLLALGQWPEVSLKDARRMSDEARALLAQAIDPGEKKKAQKARQRQLAEDTFEAVAREWIARHLSTKAPGHRGACTPSSIGRITVSGIHHHNQNCKIFRPVRRLRHSTARTKDRLV